MVAQTAAQLPDDTRRVFAENLRAACARHRSISEVCRDLGINRQQFNKYLSGASFPSAYNLRRICDYFGIDDAAMLRAQVDDAGAADPSAADLLFGPILRRMRNAGSDASRKLERYVGYYHSYYCSPAFPGRILKSVSRIYRSEGLFFDRTMERSVNRDGAHVSIMLNRYTGTVIHTDDRIYVLHQHMALHQTLSMVAFYPSYVATPRLLSGVFVSVSSGPGRQPFASRCVYEYHGRAPNLRKMLSACGAYQSGHGEIGDEISRRLDNHISDDTVLRAMEY
ncbi:MAG: helix-turn-helix transcriptional regulator [Rhizobiaceae bacterium]|nr:helix-turn-helix transcriptional regulator [Rhizobiaceae bacterium]